MKFVSSFKTRFAKLKAWARKHPRKALIFGGIFLVLVACSITYLLLSQKPAAAPTITISKPKPKPATVFYSPLTGKKVDEAATKIPLTAIMIENSPDARPQSGIKSAGVVYEAVAEGGITRFLTIFQEDKPQLIGPVRSLRMYYLDWAAGYDAGIAHIGGSAAALAEVRNGTYKDLDQFFNAGSYWRATDRYAPHNVYTSFEKLDALNAAKGNTGSNFTGFTREDDKPADTPDASQVYINFSGPMYNTAYTYDKASNTYLRSVGGQPHMDRESGQVTPSVVIAMKVNMTRVLEDGYRESISTIGQGEAVVFQNGTAINATWRKSARKAPLEIIDAAGNPIVLNRGQTWIAAVPNGQGSVSWE